MENISNVLNVICIELQEEKEAIRKKQSSMGQKPIQMFYNLIVVNVYACSFLSRVKHKQAKQV